MYEVYVAARFEAAHRLVGDFGPATRTHGHTYRMEVIVRGQRLGDDGTLYDIGELGQAVEIWRLPTLPGPERGPRPAGRQHDGRGGGLLLLGEAGKNPSAAGASTRSRYASGSPPTPTQHAKTRWIEGFLLRVAFITVGDTGRKTGGYMYNGRVIFGLRKRGFEIEEVVAGGASPDEQRTAAPGFGSTFDPSRYDAIVVDALARIAVAPHLDLWLSWRPVVALVHELPSVASGGSGPETVPSESRLRGAAATRGPARRRERPRKERALGTGCLPGRIHVVPPGLDGIPEGVGPHVQGDGPVRALCVAQWIERKGILTLVEAWALRERKGAVLELIGETDATPITPSGSGTPSKQRHGTPSSYPDVWMTQRSVPPTPRPTFSSCPRATRDTGSSMPRRSPADSR